RCRGAAARELHGDREAGASRPAGDRGLAGASDRHLDPGPAGGRSARLPGRAVGPRLVPDRGAAMTATMEAPPIADERIGAVRPTDAARLAEIVLVLARNGVVTVTRRGGALVLRPQRQA